MWGSPHDTTRSGEDPRTLPQARRTGYDCTTAASPIVALAALSVVHGTSVALGLCAGESTEQRGGSAHKACRYAAAALTLAACLGATDEACTLLGDTFSTFCPPPALE